MKKIVTLLAFNFAVACSTTYGFVGSCCSSIANEPHVVSVKDASAPVSTIKESPLTKAIMADETDLAAEEASQEPELEPNPATEENPEEAELKIETV